MNIKGSYDVKQTMNFPVFGMKELTEWYSDKRDRIPPTFLENWPEIVAFCESCHAFAMESLRALARGMGIEDEEYFVTRHLSSAPSGTYLRLLYYPSFESTTEEMEETGRYRTPAHSDIGSLTFLFQKDVGGLEVRKGYAEPVVWAPVPPRDGCATVNIADMMQFWSGGYVGSRSRDC
jgi:isopenicillin N synthase-like dioxygenase